MSMVKRHMEQVEARRERATAIAIKAGVLKVCEFHEDVVYETGEDVVEAYKRGNARYDKDSLGKIFESRTDMTDYIKEVVEEAADECWSCAKLRDED
jgi:thermostable 8-oxoguanine DNA glycosylase